jgi:shikimate dehydrogenase
MLIDGNTEVIAHLGFPTHSFKAPLIYNPYFASIDVNAVVVPLACRAEAFARVFSAVFELANVRGALITMPHKVSVLDLLDDVSAAVRVAGACNAVRRAADGRLIGDQFDGAGFVRGVQRKGFRLQGARCLVLGCGGVGRPIAASLAESGAGEIALHDVQSDAAHGLARRLHAYFPDVSVNVHGSDPAGFDLVVNATPLGMQPDDPLPLNPARLDSKTFVGDVVMRSQMTPLLLAARERGCEVQVGTDMLFEMIPCYLEFFGYPITTAENLKSLTTKSLRLTVGHVSSI